MKKDFFLVKIKDLNKGVICTSYQRIPYKTDFEYQNAIVLNITYEEATRVEVEELLDIYKMTSLNAARLVSESPICKTELVKEDLLNIGAFRIGDIVEVDGNITNLRFIHISQKKTIKPVLITASRLEEIGFYENAVPIDNGKKYYLNCCQRPYQPKNYNHTEYIDRELTWMESHYNTRNAQMTVDVFCRGNYVCTSLRYIHQIQQVFFLTQGQELYVEMITSEN